MGNDIDVSSKDKDMEKMFQEVNTNETTPQFIRRYFDKFCDSISNPVRHHYAFEDLVVPGFDNMEFNIFSGNITLHCCHWVKLDAKGNSPLRNRSKSSDKGEGSTSKPPICIIYLHTNTRSLVDALEVLPIAKVMNAQVIAMDLPGCGQSDGTLKGNLEQELLHLLEWAACLISHDTQFVLWARGMSTAPTIELIKMASMTKKKEFENIKCAVLDSPFTGIEQIVSDLLSTVQRHGHYIPKSLSQFCIKLGLKAVSRRLNGLDLFSVTPLNSVPHCRLPCLILAADEDDYIPVSHGIAIAAKWGTENKQLSIFPGHHFGIRPTSLVCSRDVTKFVASNMNMDCTMLEQGEGKIEFENIVGGKSHFSSDNLSEESQSQSHPPAAVIGDTPQTPPRPTSTSTSTSVFHKVLSPIIRSKSLSALHMNMSSMFATESKKQNKEEEDADAVVIADTDSFQHILEKELAGEDLVVAGTAP